VSSPLGVGYEASAGRDSTGLGNAWGTRGGSFIQRIFNAVIPVTIVERWYGDTDGSLFGLSAGTLGTFGLRPAVIFISTFVDWELHSINVWFPQMQGVAATGGPLEYRIATNLFTEASGFNAILINPVGPFGPQLVTNDNFNQGSVRGFGGVNPLNNPNGFGYILNELVTRVGAFGSGTVDQISDSWGRAYTNTAMVQAPIAVDKKMCNAITFRRPLRIKRGRRLAIQLTGEDATFQYNPIFSLNVSITYTELPNPRASYRTP